MASRWSEAMRWAVARRIDRGDDARAVALDVGMAPIEVARCCREMGVREPRGSREDVMSWEVDEMARLRSLGRSYGEIAEACGRGRTTVRRKLAERGGAA